VADARGGDRGDRPPRDGLGGILSAAGAYNATLNVKTKFSSAEGAITIIKEPLAAKMPALNKRANKLFYSAGGHSHRPLYRRHF